MDMNSGIAQAYVMRKLHKKKMKEMEIHESESGSGKTGYEQQGADTVNQGCFSFKLQGKKKTKQVYAQPGGDTDHPHPSSMAVRS